MTKSVTISTPYPTLEEARKSLGISKKRAKLLIGLVRKHFTIDEDMVDDES